MVPFASVSTMPLPWHSCRWPPRSEGSAQRLAPFGAGFRVRGMAVGGRPVLSVLRSGPGYVEAAGDDPTFSVASNGTGGGGTPEQVGGDGQHRVGRPPAGSSCRLESRASSPWWLPSRPAKAAAKRYYQARPCCTPSSGGRCTRPSDREICHCRGTCVSNGRDPADRLSSGTRSGALRGRSS